MNELEMRINPDIQKYCYVNNIDKPSHCMEKYINENREFKRLLISKVTREIERMTAKLMLESTNTYFNDLPQSQKEQVLRTAKKLVSQQEKFGGHKPLFETFVNNYQNNIENFQNQTADNQTPYLMKMLMKIPEVKNKFIESKAKLVIHNATDKEDIVTLLSYPRLEECLSNYEFSKCKTKHLNEAKVYKNIIKPKSKQTLPTPDDSTSSRPITQSETDIQAEQQAKNILNNMYQSGELSERVISEAEQEQLQSIIDGTSNQYNNANQFEAKAEAEVSEIPQPGLGDPQNLVSNEGFESFTDYTLGVDGSFEAKAQANSWRVHNPSKRIRKTCKKAQDLNVLKSNDISTCVSYVTSHPEVREIFSQVLENNEVYKCVLDASDPDSLNSCLFRFFVDQPNVLHDLKNVIESRVNKAYAKVALRNILEEFTTEQKQDDQNQTQPPVVGLAQPPYAAGFHDPNDPYDLNNPVKLERPIHHQEFPTKLDWPPQRYTVSQRTKQHTQDVGAHNNRPSHAVFTPLKKQEQKQKAAKN